MFDKSDTIDVKIRAMETVRDIIRAFGGNTAVGKIIGKGPSTVSEMARRGSIGVEYWPALVAASKDAEIAQRDNRAPFELTNDILVDAHTRDGPKAQAADTVMDSAAA